MIHKQSDRKMPNHGIEFDVRECTSKRDVEGRLAIIHFVANTIQLIYLRNKKNYLSCVKMIEKFFFFIYLPTFLNALILSNDG